MLFVPVVDRDDVDKAEEFVASLDSLPAHKREQIMGLIQYTILNRKVTLPGRRQGFGERCICMDAVVFLFRTIT